MLIAHPQSGSVLELGSKLYGKKIVQLIFYANFIIEELRIKSKSVTLLLSWRRRILVQRLVSKDSWTGRSKLSINVMQVEVLCNRWLWMRCKKDVDMCTRKRKMRRQMSKNETVLHRTNAGFFKMLKAMELRAVLEKSTDNVCFIKDMHYIPVSCIRSDRRGSEIIVKSLQSLIFLVYSVQAVFLSFK